MGYLGDPPTSRRNDSCHGPVGRRHDELSNGNGTSVLHDEVFWILICHA